MSDHHNEPLFKRRERLISEELGRALTAKEKFYLAMADACSPRRGKPLVLCIEDNPKYLRLRKAVLQRSGYDVIGATTGAEALEILREAPVCLVLSDHMLRGITGTDLAKQMKEIKRDVPIVLHSGTVPESLQHVDGFISKSEPPSRFLSLVYSFVQRYCE
jgi:CheY-like chemotaxis protein